MTDDQRDGVSHEPEEPPGRLDRRGLPGPDERATMVIVLLGVMVGALLLASVLGYVVYHALTEQPRTTVGLGGSSQHERAAGRHVGREVVRTHHRAASPPSAAAVRLFDRHP